MTERTVLQTMTGATLAISASLPASYNAAGYGATGMSYTSIGSVENFGEHGGSASVSEFVAVGDGVVQKFKGSKNYGSMALMLGQISSDTGQDLVDTAFESQNRYSVKLTYALGTGEATGEIHYLDVLVTRRTWQDGSANDVRKLAVTFELCRAPVVVAAT